MRQFREELLMYLMSLYELQNNSVCTLRTPLRSLRLKIFTAKDTETTQSSQRNN